MAGRVLTTEVTESTQNYSSAFCVLNNTF
jgi:hypothetical protein